MDSGKAYVGDATGLNQGRINYEKVRINPRTS